jgi:beta-N-acetylhexosaminidase
VYARRVSDLSRDVGQLLWVGFQGAVAPPELVRAIGAGDVGAVVVFKRNLSIAVAGSGGVGVPGAGGGAALSGGAAVAQEVVDLDALVELHRALHAAAPADVPVLVTMDQEGGAVQRVRAPATQWPPMLAHDGFAPPADEELAEAVGGAIGRELAALGVDVDFAPVLDVHTNPANPVIGDRAFGRDATTVARRGLAFARGLEGAGVLPCGKHFPGHGDTATDSHLELPRIDHDWSRLERVELAPFVAAAKADLPMLMTAHVVFAALDADQPATLSAKVITDLLRKRFGFGGVVLSDDLDMKAIVDHIGAPEAGVRAIRAGCDALLLCRDEQHQRDTREALVRAGEADSELRRRIGEAAERVRVAKRRAVEARRRAGVGTGREEVGSAANRALADRLAGR